jgi:hypothetical protein
LLRRSHGEAEAITRICIDKALEGDATAIRLCLERLVPVRKSRPVTIKLPTIETPEDVLAAMQAVVQSVAVGDTAPDDAQAIMGLLEQTRRAQELVDIESRLAALENNR